MQQTVHAKSPNLNIAAPLPLFAAAERLRVRALPLPARRLARRLGMSSATALAVAEAAGFVLGQEVGR